MSLKNGSTLSRERLVKVVTPFKNTKVIVRFLFAYKFGQMQELLLRVLSVSIYYWCTFTLF